MIKVSFYYPYRENGRFDIEDHCNTHMPSAIDKPGAPLNGC
jgi:hypothetical protein